MSNEVIRTRLIRLASEHPEFRKDLLPLIQKSAGEIPSALRAQVVRVFNHPDDWDIYDEVAKQFKGATRVKIGHSRFEVDSLVRNGEMLDVSGTWVMECAIIVSTGMKINGTVRLPFETNLGFDSYPEVWDLAWELKYIPN